MAPLERPGAQPRRSARPTAALAALAAQHKLESGGQGRQGGFLPWRRRRGRTALAAPGRPRPGLSGLKRAVNQSGRQTPRRADKVGVAADPAMRRDADLDAGCSRHTATRPSGVIGSTSGLFLGPVADFAETQRVTALRCPATRGWQSLAVAGSRRGQCVLVLSTIRASAPRQG